MRHYVCTNTTCANENAPYFDNEPAEVVVLCPVCEKAMTVVTLEQVAARNTEKRAAAEEIAALEEQKATAAAAAEPAPAPTPREQLVDKLAAMVPDAPVTASDLLAILRPDTMAADDAPAPSDHPAAGA